MERNLVPWSMKRELQGNPSKEAQELRCGDLFLFREEILLCLSNLTDKRHTTSTITCVPYEEMRAGTVKTIKSILFFRTVRVQAGYLGGLNLEVLSLTQEEIANDEAVKLALTLAQDRAKPED